MQGDGDGNPSLLTVMVLVMYIAYPLTVMISVHPFKPIDTVSDEIALLIAYKIRIM